jgi:hypothetical protein
VDWINYFDDAHFEILRKIIKEIDSECFLEEYDERRDNGQLHFN